MKFIQNQKEKIKYIYQKSTNKEESEMYVFINQQIFGEESRIICHAI